VAVANLIPAKKKGGTYSNPTLIASHVEPQRKHSAAKTAPDALDFTVANP